MGDTLPSRREPAALAAHHHGVVLGSGDSPVEGATVSWSPLPSAQAPHRLAQFHSDWTARDAERLVEASVFATTDSGGRFRFEHAPTVENGRSVLWATHPSYDASYFVLASGASVDPLDWPEVVLRLAPAEPLRVRVLSASAPQPNATVWLFGANHSADSDRTVRDALIRSFMTNEDGIAVLHPLPGPEGLRAVHGGRASKARMGDLSGEVILRVYDTFTADGFVEFDPGLSLDDEYSVTVRARTGHIEQLIATIVVQESGSWGPVEVPLLGDEHYDFQFRGSTAIPLEESRPAPSSGDRVSISFQARPGNDVWAIVADTEGEILYDSRVFARWSGEPAGTMTARPFPIGHEFEGYVLMRGIPDGTLNISGYCEGYAPEIYDPIQVPVDSSTWEVRLLEAGTVHGRVLFEGEPVDTFEVCYWNEDTEASAWRTTFTDREDGSFELTEAPTGELWLVASSRERPRGDPVMTRLEPGATSEVLLHLQEGITGRARVIDQLSEAPVAGATAQLFVRVGRRNVAYFGRELSTDSEGELVVQGLIPGINPLRVEAPGYADNWVMWEVSEGESPSLEIPLREPRLLKVQVRGVAPEEWDRYAVQVEAQSTPGRIPVPSSGNLEFGPLTPRGYAVTLYRDGSVFHSTSTYCPPIGDWTKTFDLDSSRRLIVSVVPETGSEIPSPLYVSALATTSSGVDVQIVEDVLGDKAVFTGLPVGPVMLTANGPDLVDLGTGYAEQYDGDTVADLRLSNGQLRMRIVDAKGNAIPGVRASLRSVDDRFSYPLQGATNMGGLLAAPGFGEGDYEAHIAHDTLGRSIQLVHLGEELTDIELVATGSLTVSLQHGSAPVDGARCVLRCTTDEYYVGTRDSDRQGRVMWERISAPSLRLDVVHPGYWPASELVELGNARVHREIELIPLGSLLLELRDSSGQPITNTTVELRSLKLDESVASWIERGHLEQRATTSDDSGRIELHGIPSGDYSWSCLEVSGRVTAGNHPVRSTLVLP